MTTATPTRKRFWRSTLSGGRWWIPIVVAHAALQGLLTIGDPVPAPSWAFGALTAVSAVGVIVAVWLLSCVAAWTAAGDQPQWSPRRLRRAALGWTTVVTAGTVVAGIGNPLAVPFVLVWGLFPLTAAAAGSGRPLTAGFRAVRGRPAAYLSAAVGGLIGTAISWAVALALGLFLAGPAAAVLSWLWNGAFAVGALSAWAWIYSRPTPTAVPRSPH